MTAWQSKMNTVIQQLTKQSTTDAGLSTVLDEFDLVADQNEGDDEEDVNDNNNDD